LLVLVDVGEDGPRRVAPLVEVEILESARDHRLLVRRVVDDEIRLDANRGAVNAEQLRARRVKRPDPERASQVRAAESFEPGAHLAGRLVGERDGEDAPGRYADVRDEVRDAIGDDARLAAARAREDEKRPVMVGDRAGLRFVEVRLGGAQDE
jgi:hypothetical protein